MAVKSYDISTYDTCDMYRLTVRGLAFTPDLYIIVPPILQPWVQTINSIAYHGIYEVELDFVFPHYFIVAELSEIVVTEAADRMLR
jgi:hypothetical protein